MGNQGPNQLFHSKITSCLDLFRMQLPTVILNEIKKNVVIFNRIILNREAYPYDKHGLVVAGLDF